MSFSKHTPRIVGAFLLLTLALCFAPTVRAATNTVIFDLGNFGADAVAYKQVKIAPSDSSFPRVEGVTVRGRDYGVKLTDANGRLTNDMVTGTYTITFTNRFLATSFQITVPSTNSSSALYASELTTSGTNLPSNLVGYSQTAADGMFAKRTNSPLYWQTSAVNVATFGITNINFIPGANTSLAVTNTNGTVHISIISAQGGSGDAGGTNARVLIQQGVANAMVSTNQTNLGAIYFGADGQAFASNNTAGTITIVATNGIAATLNPVESTISGSLTVADNFGTGVGVNSRRWTANAPGFFVHGSGASGLNVTSSVASVHTSIRLTPHSTFTSSRMDADIQWAHSNILTYSAWTHWDNAAGTNSWGVSYGGTAASTGISGHVPFIHHTNGTLLLQQAGGNVGIGTNAPTASLHVHGTNIAHAFAHVAGGNARDVNGNLYATNSTGIASNAVVVAAGSGGITVTPSGSGGVMTFTVSDDDAGTSASTNFMSVVITNALKRQTVWQAFDTNQSISWAGTNYVIIQPTQTVTIAFANTPAAGQPAQTLTLDVYWTNASGSIVFPSAIDWRGDGPHLVTGITNRFWFDWNGTNLFGSSGQDTNQYARISSVTFFTNWVGSVSNLTQTKQHGTEVLTNLSSTASNNVHYVTASTFLTNWANSVSNLVATKQHGDSQLTNYANSTIDVPVGNVMSNFSALKFQIQQPAITDSNLLVSFATNNYECVGLTNVQLTNIVEEATGVNGRAKVVIRNTLGVSVPLMLPAFGAQHGYYFHTNGLNDILSAAVAPPGTNTIVSLEIDGTNVYPSVTYWRHP